MNNQKSRIFSFPPSIGISPELLILGSMPGAESLRLQQYYAHPKNRFWKIIGALIGFNHEKTPYLQRLDILKQNKIALWDVTYSCVRPGSMDSDIRDAVLNDFETFFSENPSIKKILCNGQTAFKIFSRRVSIEKLDDAEIISLPSTSPAFASMRFDEKLSLWRAALKR